MARLLRPPIPLAVALRVLLRQLGEMFPDQVVAAAKAERSLGTAVAGRTARLAELLGCAPPDLDCDHDPPLGAREKVFDRDGKHVGYKPDANDPEWLVFRVRADHRIKTNVRGEHGQHPDRVLIKKNRRLERREKEAAGLVKPKRKAKIKGRSRFASGRKIPSRPFPKTQRPLRG